MAKAARLVANDRAKDRASGSRAKAVRTERRPKSQYYAFLSYSHKDEELAEWLHGELEDFHVPPALTGKLTANGVIPRRLAPIFRDKQELAAATDLGAEIRAALAASQFLVVLCSPSAAESRWANAEIEAFKRARPDGCVLAVIASGEPFASDISGRESEECFPPALRERYDKRGRPTGKRSEPIAADLRGDNDSRRMGFLKLVAGMLGVGLDDLVRRETTRRQRRLAWLSAASLSGMVIASVLAITAIQARDSARDQRREAEGLVAFMLGDLKDKLEPIGRLDALDGVGTKVLDYYSKQGTSDLSDNALMQRSQALSLSAQVSYLRGHLDTAQKLYREAMEGTGEAVARSPNDPQRLFDQAQNVFWIGSIAADRGQLDQAEAAFREYRRLAEKMAAIAPDNLKWRMEVQYAEANLGIILLRQRRFAEAASQFATALKTIEAVAAVDQSNQAYQKSVAESLAWLADAELARGDLTAATQARAEQVSLLKSLAAKSDDVQFQQKLIPAQSTLGRLLAAQGQDEQAIVQLGSAVATANRLLPTEPGNSKWVEFAATAYFALADEQTTTGQLAAAAASIGRGCGLASILERLSGAATDWRLSAWRCADRSGDLALSQGDTERSLELGQRATEIARHLRSGDAVGDSYLLAQSLSLTGEGYQRRGNTAEAQRIWRSALALTSAANEQPWESAVRAHLLSRLGRADEANAIIARLTSSSISNPQAISI